MVAVDVEDVVVRTRGDSRTPSPGRHQTVLLKARSGDRVLPIHFGPGVAVGDIVTLQLVDRSPSSALTYDLLARLLQVSGAVLEQVVLSCQEKDVYAATLRVRCGAETHLVEAGPGDALNLALRCGAPILVDESLLDEKGLPVGQIFEALEAEYRQGNPAGAAVGDETRWHSLVSRDWLPGAPPQP